MPLQRVRGAESRARNSLSNGPLRVQGNKAYALEYSATCGHTSVAEDMWVSCKVHRFSCEFKVAPRIVFLFGGSIVRP